MTIERPDKFPKWATLTQVSHVTGVPNIVEPPESKKSVGWNYGEPPARNFFNWLHRKTYEWLVYLDDRINKRQVMRDGNGDKLFPLTNSLLVLYAIDKTNPANYLHAVGYRGSNEPILNELQANVLTLGAASNDGSQLILGRDPADIMVFGISQLIDTK